MGTTGINVPVRTTIGVLMFICTICARAHNIKTVRDKTVWHAFAIPSSPEDVLTRDACWYPSTPVLTRPSPRTILQPFHVDVALNEQ